MLHAGLEQRDACTQRSRGHGAQKDSTPRISTPRKRWARRDARPIKRQLISSTPPSAAGRALLLHVSLRCGASTKACSG
jgi:hypothetical protein